MVSWLRAPLQVVEMKIFKGFHHTCRDMGVATIMVM